MYCIIPIFKEPFLHPLHKDNGLSALWCKEISKKESMFIIEQHPDSDKMMEDYKWLNDYMILTRDKKPSAHSVLRPPRPPDCKTGAVVSPPLMMARGLLPLEVN